MEKNTAHLLASSKFGRQAHQSKPARYVMCKAEKELWLSKVTPRLLSKVTPRDGDMKMTQPSHTPKPVII